MYGLMLPLVLFLTVMAHDSPQSMTQPTPPYVLVMWALPISGLVLAGLTLFGFIRGYYMLLPMALVLGGISYLGVTFSSENRKKRQAEDLVWSASDVFKCRDGHSYRIESDTSGTILSYRRPGDGPFRLGILLRIEGLKLAPFNNPRVDSDLHARLPEILQCQDSKGGTLQEKINSLAQEK